MVRFRLSRHRHTGRTWVLTTTSVIRESGKQTPSPDLDSELAINTMAAFPVQF